MLWKRIRGNISGESKEKTVNDQSLRTFKKNFRQDAPGHTVNSISQFNFTPLNLSSLYAQTYVVLYRYITLLNYPCIQEQGIMLHETFNTSILLMHSLCQNKNFFFLWH